MDSQFIIILCFWIYIGLLLYFFHLKKKGPFIYRALEIFNLMSFYNIIFFVL